MNSQNTPVHIRLWHREFWQMALANMLLSASVYMLIPVLPMWLASAEHFSALQIGWCMGVYAVGLFLLGPFCSYLVQRYRRNVVCLWAIFALVACVGLLWYADRQCELMSFEMVFADRLLLGATFGLAQMILSSTLVIDTCESYLRTEANHSISWFGRFGLSVGPLVGLLAVRQWGYSVALLMPMACALCALVLIRMVKFPFRAPADHVKVACTDRFWLGSGFALFANLWMVAVAVGLIVVVAGCAEFYGALMVGFLLAILAQRFVFRDAELKSEVVSGLILLLAAVLLLLVRPTLEADYIAAVLVGVAVGVIASRFLLFFIKLSRHCQRGTSQSTYMLAWESGLAIGVGAGCILPVVGIDALPVALVLVVVSLLFYNCFAHQWFVKHKNR